MKTIITKLVVLTMSSLLLMACYKKEGDANYGFFRATAVYLSGDVQSIDFNDLNKSKYNDLIYKNILVKFTMLQSYPNDISKFKLDNLNSDIVNSLCLASIFVEKYQPLNNEMAKAHSESQQKLIRLRSFFLEDLRKDGISGQKYDCLEVVKKVD